MLSIQEYLGPKEYVDFSDLDKYDNGQWVAQEKHDGCWCLIQTDAEGKITKLSSRKGIDFTKNETLNLKGLNIGIPSAKLIGELETGSQAAVERYSKLGYRRIFLHDIIALCGENARELEQHQRSELLAKAYGNIVALGANKFIFLIEECDNEFKDFYKKIINRGGEGIILKRKKEKYNGGNSEGKVWHWLRCKPERTVDYYVIGTGLTAKGDSNLTLGLMKNGRMTRVMSLTCPREHKAEDLVGKVIQCRGREIMRSGALRHAQFDCIREDKTKEMCVAL